MAADVIFVVLGCVQKGVALLVKCERMNEFLCKIRQLLFFIIMRSLMYE